MFEAGPLALERGGVAGGEELAEVFLDAPRDGEFDVLLEDLGEAGALPDGEPVVGAGEQLPIRPGGVDLATAPLLGLPHAAPADLGDHVVGEPDDVPVVDADLGLGQRFSDGGAELGAHVDRDEPDPATPPPGPVGQPRGHRGAAAAVDDVEQGAGVQGR